MKNFRYMIEAMLLHIAFFIFSLLPVEKASNFGGWIGRTIGPKLAASRKAKRHLQQSLPNRDDYNEIIKDMWENLGRTMAEYPHLKEIVGSKYTRIEGLEHIKNLKSNENAIMFSAHIGNWELLGPAMAAHHGGKTSLVYRAPNNPYVEAILQKCRNVAPQITTIPKSRSGAKSLLQAVQNKEFIGILIDQKYNEGLAIPFFGRPAMTSPAFVQLAQKFKTPLIPVCVERLKGPNFQITLYPPMDIEGKTTEAVMEEAHHILENWIKKTPGQWLWLHRRWSENN